MKEVGLRPRAHVFVCENRREGSPLGPGCGAAGERVFEALKREVADRGAIQDVWVTRTRCLGSCPKSGTTVALYPMGAVLTEVLPQDCEALFGLIDREEPS